MKEKDEIMENGFLTKQLELIQQKKHNPNITWQDLANLRKKECFTEEHLTKDVIRKGAVLLNEYLNNGWQLIPPKHEGVSKVVLSISDIHYPFHLPVDTFREWSGKIDILQLNGDLLDCASFSKFPKTFRSNIVDDMIGLRQYLIDLITMIKPDTVIANYGNHEARLETYLSKAFGGYELQELMPKTLLDYIFTEGFNHYDHQKGTKTFYQPLEEVIDDVLFDYQNNWYSQFGSALFVHPKAFSSGMMKTAEKAILFFNNTGLDFDTVVMAHTHKVGLYKQGKTLIEQGCCCDVSKMAYTDGLLTNPQKEGYVVLYFNKDGNVIHDLTKLVCLN